MSTATDFFAWFILQIVTAGNGILEIVLNVGLIPTITGDISHFMKTWLMKYAENPMAAIKETIQNNLKKIFYVN